MPITTDCAFGAEMRKYARPRGSTIGYWYPGALSGEGLASGAGCVAARVVGVVAGGAEGWASAVAPTARNDTNNASMIRMEFISVSPFERVSIRSISEIAI